MIKRFKSQKGAISLFALLSVMFFLAFMIGAYRIVSSNNVQQIISIADIQKRYALTKEEAIGKYNGKIAASTDAIPIRNFDQFKLVYAIEKYYTSPVPIENSFVDNGIVYKCTKDSNYYLAEDININIDDVMTVNNFEFFDYFLDPSNLHIKFDTAGHKFYYYKNIYNNAATPVVTGTRKYLLLSFQDIDRGKFVSSTMNISYNGNDVSSITDIHTAGVYSNFNAIVGNKITNFYSDTNGYEFLLMYPKNKTDKKFNPTYYNIWQQKLTPLTKNTAITYKKGDIRMLAYDGSDVFKGVAISSSPSSALLDGTVGVGNWWYSICSFADYSISGVNYLPGPGNSNDYDVRKLCAFFIRVS